MLFRKKMERFCAYCAFAGKIDDESVICKKCGVVPSTHHCRRFRYDPLKRVPPQAVTENGEAYRDADFTL
ncbi:MAG: hypothetical protein IJT18_06860 [Oscillospiraceae bacterium]|nr:hypothetical protein [Oscillospiraceae bacterium]